MNPAQRTPSLDDKPPKEEDVPPLLDPDNLGQRHPQLRIPACVAAYHLPFPGSDSMACGPLSTPILNTKNCISFPSIKSFLKSSQDSLCMRTICTDSNIEFKCTPSRKQKVQNLTFFQSGIISTPEQTDAAAFFISRRTKVTGGAA
jgi:hypothetical protein